MKLDTVHWYYPGILVGPTWTTKGLVGAEAAVMTIKHEVGASLCIYGVTLNYTYFHDLSL